MSKKPKIDADREEILPPEIMDNLMFNPTGEELIRRAKARQVEQKDIRINTSDATEK